MAKFAERLKYLRTGKGLSQADFAKQIKLSKSSVNMYERGEREPGIETLECIADYFNVDMDYLLGKSDVVNKNIERAQVQLSMVATNEPSLPSGKRLEMLFNVSGYDLVVVCFNLDIDQTYLDNWISCNELPPKPIVDKILGVFWLKPKDLLSARELSIYNQEALEWADNSCSHFIPIAVAASPKANDFSDDEIAMIDKFRCLDDRGKAAVLNALNHEYESLPGEKARTSPKNA